MYPLIKERLFRQCNKSFNSGLLLCYGLSLIVLVFVMILPGEVSALSFGPLLTTRRVRGNEEQYCCMYDQFSVESTYSQIQSINSTLIERTGRTKLFYDFSMKRMREDTILSIDGKNMTASVISLQLLELTYVYYIKNGTCTCFSRLRKWNPLCVPMSKTAIHENGREYGQVKISNTDNSIVYVSKDRTDGGKCSVARVQYSVLGMETKTDFFNLNRKIDHTHFTIPLFCPRYANCVNL